MCADAPDIFMGGVGQTASGVEVYGSPQIGVFMQGNDHTLNNAHVHDAARQRDLACALSKPAVGY